MMCLIDNRGTKYFIMRIISLLLTANFILLSIISLGQSKISKRERIKEYKTSSADYVPENVKEYEVLFVDIDFEELLKRIKNAHYLSYSKNGIDTLSKPKAFSDGELEVHKKSKEKSFQDLKDIKKLQKQLRLKIIKPNQLGSFDVNTHRYLLDIGLSSNKPSPEAMGWVITLDLFFVDRLTGKKYKRIDDWRISIADLVD